MKMCQSDKRAMVAFKKDGEEHKGTAELLALFGFVMTIACIVGFFAVVCRTR